MTLLPVPRTELRRTHARRAARRPRRERRADAGHPPAPPPGESSPLPLLLHSPFAAVPRPSSRRTGSAGGGGAQPCPALPFPPLPPTAVPRSPPYSQNPAPGGPAAPRYLLENTAVGAGGASGGRRGPGRRRRGLPRHHGDRRPGGAWAAAPAPQQGPGSPPPPRGCPRRCLTRRQRGKAAESALDGGPAPKRTPAPAPPTPFSEEDLSFITIIIINFFNAPALPYGAAAALAQARAGPTSLAWAGPLLGRGLREGAGPVREGGACPRGGACAQGELFFYSADAVGLYLATGLRSVGAARTTCSPPETCSGSGFMQVLQIAFSPSSSS